MKPQDLFRNSPILTVPNVLSVLRLVLLIPFTLIAIEIPSQPENLSLIGWIVIVILLGMLSDFLDGFIARKWNQSSELGRFLDPIIDKTVTITAMVILTLYYSFPVWMLSLCLFREILGIFGGALLYLHYDEQGKPNYWGKWGVGLSAIAILWYILLPWLKLQLDDIDHPLLHPEYLLYLLAFIIVGGIIVYARTYIPGMIITKK